MLQYPRTASSEVWDLHRAADPSYMDRGGRWLLTLTPFHEGCPVGCGLASILTSESCARVQTVLRSCSTAAQTFKQRNVQERADSPHHPGCGHLHTPCTRTHTHTRREVNRVGQEGKLKRPNEINLRQYTLELQRFPSGKHAFP